LTASRTKIGKTSGGRSLTNDLIKELAEKAEAGYDVEETLDRRRQVKTQAIEANQDKLRRRAAISEVERDTAR
jgi:hypothetical protein